MLLISRTEVEALLDADALVDALATAMADLSAGRASVPPRVAAEVPERSGLVLAMPGHVPSVGALAVKVVSLFPGNAGTPVPTHQAVVVVCDPATGTPVAFMDGTALTERRTAAGSALATRLLARADARVLAVLGTGVQARAHALALPRVRALREIRVAGRDSRRARALCAELARALPEAQVRACASWAEALDGADVVAAATSSAEPVVRREWLAPGAHVNAVGASLVTARELDSATVAAARLYVDRRESALNEAGDFLVPKREGLVDDDHIVGEIGELLVDPPRISGRRSSDELTVFKSLGLAIEDVAAARRIYDRAVATGVGSWVDIGGLRDADA
jgi:alanine dehydrogenase